MTSGLQRAAARVVELRDKDIGSVQDWAEALDDLSVAVERERRRGAERVARSRARRKETTDGR